MPQSTQKTNKKIAFDVLVFSLRVALLCIEMLLRFTCNFTQNNKYSLQVIRNILKLLILPAIIKYLFDSINGLSKSSENPKREIRKIEIIAKKLAIIWLCFFILINVNFHVKFFFEEVFICNKKANEYNYYVPLLDPVVVNYLFITAAVLFVVSSTMKYYSAYDKAYRSNESTDEDKKSFYKSVGFLLLDLTIFFTETLGYEIIHNKKLSISPDITYDFDFVNILNRIRDFFYLQSSFYS
ncbi:MAG: hypothetical protein PV345_00100 [Wolbachia sp.]|nr:hypothetical protein [Wolbachia sp.]